MARPLTKKKKGILYVRAPAINKEIDEAVNLDPSDLQKRLLISTPKQPGYFRAETLVHLARKGVREDNKQVTNIVIRVLFARCEANLRVKVLNSLPNAQKIREDVLALLGTLIARDGTGKVPDRLDPFECTFNLSFRSLRYDAIRKETKAVNKIATIPERINSVNSADVDAEFEKVANRRRAADPNTEFAPSPEDYLIAQEIHQAINKLPENERKALVLVKVVGLTELEAGKMLNVSDRTIRTRVKSAKARLGSLKEYT